MRRFAERLGFRTDLGDRLRFGLRQLGEGVAFAKARPGLRLRENVVIQL